MLTLKRLLLLACLIIGLSLIANAQSLTGEARSHWNKASIYLENATTESEWQLAVVELEQVVRLAPNFSDAYLKLGDAYSNLNGSESVEKATYYWKEYERRVPASASEIQDKIDRLEAVFAITSLRNREKIIESLIGRWRRSKDSTNDFGCADRDMEIFREGNRLMLRYVSYYFWYNGDQGEPGGTMSYKEIPLNGDSIVIEYEQIGEWRDLKDGKIDDFDRFKDVCRFVITSPQVDGVIKGREQTSSGGYYPPASDFYVYKVN